MKKKKSSKKPKEFPKNYRFITESKYYINIKKYYFRLSNQPKVNQFFKFTTIVLMILTVLILIFGISIFSLSFYRYYQNYTMISSQRQLMQSQINFWKSVSDKYDGYKDAYFRMALLEYSLGDIKTARMNNEKALLLDPNFLDAKKLEVELNKAY